MTVAGCWMQPITRRSFMQAGATTAAASATSHLNAQKHGEKEESLPFAVVFEVRTTADTHQTYLDTAKQLRPLLDRIPGFLSIERSVSIHRDQELLSLSYWADEAALVQWRSTGEHHAAQQAGRDGIFADYRLRVGPVLSRIPPFAEIDTESPSLYNREPFHTRQF